MRFTAFTFSILAAALSHAAEIKPPGDPATDLTPREAALDRLLSDRDSTETFNAAIAEARKQAISEQAILEARFIFHVDRQEDEAIAALLPDFLKQEKEFKLQDSEIFATKEDWLAVVEYVKAIVAIRGGDKAAFKKHITEAFWLSPKQGTAFAPHIERMRLAETMASVKLDFQNSFPPLAGGQAIALSKLTEGKKALLLQFWSPWSAECEASLPDFISITSELEKNSIAVATIILEGSPKSLTDTQAILKPLNEKPPGAWLVDRDRDPLSATLRIQNVPTLVLVSEEGSILFNGPSSSKDLWTALQKINPSVKQPALSSLPPER